jgi:hypothetical protein
MGGSRNGDTPTKEEDLINSDIVATRSPHTFTFTGDSRGDGYFSLRWVNGRVVP